MQILNAIQTTRAIFAFVKSGGLEADLAALELDAALYALRNVQLARDRHSQVWSVINHLETAEVGLVSAIASNDMLTLAVRSYSIDVDESKLFLVRALIAACYLYVGERKLFAQTVHRMRSALSIDRVGGWDTITGNMIHAFSGLIFVNMFFAKGDILNDEQKHACVNKLEAIASRIKPQSSRRRSS